MLSVACTEAQLQDRVFHMPLQDDGLEQINTLLPQLEGADWFYLLQPGDRPVAPALLVMADRIAHSRSLTCLYSDEGSLRDGESAEPAFKPDFNLDLMRSYPYVGRALAFQRERFLALGGFAPTFAELAPHDMLWRMAESDGLHVIGHVAEVLLESSSTCRNGSPSLVCWSKVREFSRRICSASALLMKSARTGCSIVSTTVTRSALWCR